MVYSKKYETQQRQLTTFSSGASVGKCFRQIGDEKFWESEKQKSLGIEIGRNLNFHDHVI